MKSIPLLESICSWSARVILAALVAANPLALGAATNNAANTSTNTPQSAPAAAPRIAPLPKWVIPVQFERPSRQTMSDPAQGQRLLLHDHQINGRENESYTRRVRQVLNRTGIQEGSQVLISFDPSQERLSLHWLRVLRGTNVIDKLKLDQMKLIRPEGLGEHPKRQHEVVFALQDIGAGDLIDVAYSLSALAPAQDEKFSGVFHLQATERVEHWTTRLLWPAQRRLFQKDHGSGAKPRLGKKGNDLEYVWDLRRAPAVAVEDGLPSWYQPMAWVELSEYQSWAEVNQWAVKHFAPWKDFSPEVLKRIGEWKKLPRREDRVLAALHFVQEEASAQPTQAKEKVSPMEGAEVLGARFGESREKAQLLAGLARALEVEAWPVLVNSQAQHTVAEWLPSSRAFNRAIVLVRCEGQSYWVDPSRRHQSGSLSEHYLPPYGCGLVIAPGTQALTAIAESTVDSKTTVSATFRVGLREEPAEVTVVTVALGRDAEELRGQLQSSERQALEARQLNAFALLYPGTKALGSMQVSDNPEENKVELTQRYALESIWTQPTKEDPFRCNFYPHNLAAALDKPEVSFRAMPLGRRYPQHLIFRAEVFLPGVFPMELGKKTVEGSHFSFRREAQLFGHTLRLEYEYRGRGDAIPGSEVHEHLQRVDQAREILQYSVFYL